MTNYCIRLINKNEFYLSRLRAFPVWGTISPDVCGLQWETHGHRLGWFGREQTNGKARPSICWRYKLHEGERQISCNSRYGQVQLLTWNEKKLYLPTSNLFILSLIKKATEIWLILGTNTSLQKDRRIPWLSKIYFLVIYLSKSYKMKVRKNSHLTKREIGMSLYAYDEEDIWDILFFTITTCQLTYSILAKIMSYEISQYCFFI